MLWARLTWQAADPPTLVADLEQWLGLRPRRHATLPGAFMLPLGTADLELVPWRRESPEDEPRAAGRLVFEPIDGGAQPETPLGPSAELPSLVLSGVCWATVELDRAERELDQWLEPAAPDRDPASETVEPHLGARVRLREAPGLPGSALVLSEPVTEGRLAASLARDGEGPAALYLWPADGLEAWLGRARGRRVAALPKARGPFGESVLLGGSALGGPSVIVVEHSRPSSPVAPTGTIAP